MAAIDLTPAQVATQLARTATRSVTEPAPPLDEVSVRFFKRAGDPMQAEVTWMVNGRIHAVEVQVNQVVPSADMPALRTALGRCLVGAREATGAT